MDAVWIPTPERPCWVLEFRTQPSLRKVCDRCSKKFTEVWIAPSWGDRDVRAIVLRERSSKRRSDLKRLSTTATFCVRCAILAGYASITIPEGEPS